MRQSRSVGGNPIGALSLAQELSRAGLEPLAQRFEVVGSRFAIETEELRSTSVPEAPHPLAFGVVVAMLEMPGRNIPFRRT